eukprot:m51a1_g5725 hypothetical protein (1369) ;mRNA; f:1114477-1120359
MRMASRALARVPLPLLRLLLLAALLARVRPASAGSLTTWTDWQTPVVISRDFFGPAASTAAAPSTARNGSSSSTTGSWLWFLRDSDTVAGSALTPIGDINGDGYADYVSDASKGPVGSGRFGVVVFLGSRQGTADTCSDVIKEPVDNAVGCYGDVNGDGLDDVAFGVVDEEHDDDPSLAFVFGSANRSFPLAKDHVDGSNGFTLSLGHRFRMRYVGIGDVNGDNRSDFALATEIDIPWMGRKDVVVVLFGRNNWHPHWKMPTMKSIKNFFGPGYVMIPNYRLQQAHFELANSGGIFVDNDTKADLLLRKSDDSKEKVLFGSDSFVDNVMLSSVYKFCQSGNESPSLELGDVNGDGIPDMLTREQHGDECVFTVSRGIFSLLTTMHVPVPGMSILDRMCLDMTAAGRIMRLVRRGSCESAVLRSIGDIDGDRLFDYFFDGHIALGSQRNVNVSAGQGVSVISDLEATLSGFSSTGVGDINKDGVPDFAFAKVNETTHLWDIVVVTNSKWRNVMFPISKQGNSLGWLVVHTDFPVANCTLSLSSLGDHNGDKIDDMLVGVLGNSETGVRALVLLGPSLAQSTFTTNYTYDASSSVKPLGDIDGDGLADFGLETHATNERSRAFVIYGSRSISGGTVVDIDTMGWDLPDGYGAGRSANLTGVGDINGDGLADVVLDMAQCGWMRVLLGSRKRLAGLDDGVVLSPGQAYGIPFSEEDCNAWVVIRPLGDINGDLIDDFGVGLPFESNSKGHKLAGKIYVVFGSKAAGAWARKRSTGNVMRLDTTINTQRGTGFVVDGAILFDQLGSTFGSAGDINGDGVGDMFIGMPESLATAGQVYIVLGRNDSADCDSDTSACWRRRVDSASVFKMSEFTSTDGYQLVGSDRGSRLGSYVGKIGDIDGDGSDDIIIGSPVAETAGPQRMFSGSVIVLGSQQMRLVAPSWSSSLSRVSMEGSRSIKVPGISVWTRHCGAVGSASSSCKMQRNDPTLKYTVRATHEMACDWNFDDDVARACEPTVSREICSFSFEASWNSTCATLVARDDGWAHFDVAADFEGSNVALSIAVNNSHGNTAGMDLKYSLVQRSRTAAIIGGAVGGFFGLVVVVIACSVFGMFCYRGRLIKELYKWEPRVWHFEESLRPSARRDRQDYSLIAPGRVDMDFVLELYQRCPVPGYDIAKVDIIYSPHLEQAFENRVAQLQARAGNSAFAPSYAHDGSSDLRTNVVQRLAEMAGKTPEPAYPNVKLVPMWHGTRAEVLESVFRAGFANLATTDEGFFGKGVYSAYEARYASEVYSKGALLVNWVSFYSAYPVVDGDMDKLTGKGCYANYDAHFIPVHPATDEPGEQNFLACSQLSQAVFHELAVFEASQSLPSIASS